VTWQLYPSPGNDDDVARQRLLLWNDDVAQPGNSDGVVAPENNDGARLGNNEDVARQQLEVLVDLAGEFGPAAGLDHIVEHGQALTVLQCARLAGMADDSNLLTDEALHDHRRDRRPNVRAENAFDVAR